MFVWLLTAGTTTNDGNVVLLRGSEASHLGRREGEHVLGLELSETSREHFYFNYKINLVAKILSVLEISRKIKSARLNEYY